MANEHSTAGFYDRNIYGVPDGFEKTIPIGPHDTPSSSLMWFYDLGICAPPEYILEAGCGAGRNLREARRIWPEAKLFGFDGSPNAVEIAQSNLPDAVIDIGDLHGEWPLGILGKPQFDVILDITASLQESPTPESLKLSARSMFNALKIGGHAIIEGIAPDDAHISSLSRLAMYTDDDFIVEWELNGSTKPERAIGLAPAIRFYQEAGFKLLNSRRTENLTEETFSKTTDRSLIQFVLEKI